VSSEKSMVIYVRALGIEENEILRIAEEKQRVIYICDFSFHGIFRVSSPCLFEEITKCIFCIMLSFYRKVTVDHQRPFGMCETEHSQ